MTFTIDLERPREGVSLIRFRDPVRCNQLCWAAVDELAQTAQAARESGARVLILASSLSGHWFEHAWLKDLLAGIDGDEQTGEGRGWFALQQELTHEAVVSIAAISGNTSGGGAELGWACDLRVAEEHALFSQPEINMGLTTGIGGCSRLSRLAGRATAAEMTLTGRPYTARRLYELGALNEVVSAGQAIETALQIADRLSGFSGEALAGTKRILNGCMDEDLHTALKTEQTVFQSVVAGEGALQGMRRVQRAYDAGESVAAANHYKDWTTR